MEWNEGIDKETRDKFIMWLTGAAGAGKSAIGRTVAELCAKEGSLLASFFFDSTDTTRNHIRSFVATITYQICRINPTIREAVSNFVEYDPLIFTRSLKTQFLELVINPLAVLLSLEKLRVPNLIIIDALDECGERNVQRSLLSTLHDITSNSSIGIRFLICSRPENDICSTFSNVKMRYSHTRLILNERYYPDEDIELFLRDRLNDIKEGHIFRNKIPPS